MDLNILSFPSADAGMTALHMTALRQCPSSMQLLLLCGATTTLGTLEGSNLLSKGSTALHIAAARGSQPCCSVLLDHDSGRRGQSCSASSVKNPKAWAHYWPKRLQCTTVLQIGIDRLHDQSLAPSP